jgi:hypothetical protein
LKFLSTLDITAELGPWPGRRRLFKGEPVPFVLDRACNRRTPVRRQALVILVAFPAVCLVERVLEQRVGERDYFLFRAFAELPQRQLAPIGEGEVQLKRPHLCDRAVFTVPHLIELDDRVFFGSSQHDRAIAVRPATKNSGMLCDPPDWAGKILHAICHCSSQKLQRRTTAADDVLNLTS